MAAKPNTFGGVGQNVSEQSQYRRLENKVVRRKFSAGGGAVDAGNLRVKRAKERRDGKFALRKI